MTILRVVVGSRPGKEAITSYFSSNSRKFVGSAGQKIEVSPAKVVAPEVEGLWGAEASDALEDSLDPSSATPNLRLFGFDCIQGFRISAAFGSD